MIWALIFVTSTGVQTVGSFTTQDACNKAAEAWRQQSIKAGCVQQRAEPKPEDVMALMINFMRTMKKEME
jgi:hypothetical protein